MAEETRATMFQCARCAYTTRVLSDFLNHPCQQRQITQQQQLEQRIRRIKLDQYLFCSVCGCCRRKADEGDRRAGKLHFGYVRDHCLICQTHYDQDWSFLEKIFVLPQGSSITLLCPYEGCAGELQFERDAFWPILEWSPGRRKREQPIPRLKRKHLYRTCESCQRQAQPQLLLPFPKNRLRLLSILTASQKHYEMEQLRQLERFDPTDERVSREAWDNWHRMWHEREAKVAWEVQHGGRYVPYPANDDPTPLV